MVTDTDRLHAVQEKLTEVKAWVDETLRIISYVCVDADREAFNNSNEETKLTPPQPSSKASGFLYEGQYEDKTIVEEIEGETEECSS